MEMLVRGLGQVIESVAWAREISVGMGRTGRRHVVGRLNKTWKVHVMNE